VIQNISETAFAYNVEDALRQLGWQFYHPRPARVKRHGRETYETPYSGHKGWLDYVALKPPRVLVFELKDNRKPMTPEQEEWWQLWEECKKSNPNIELYLWRPRDMDKILELL